MKFHTKVFPLELVSQKPVAPSLKLAITATNIAQAIWPIQSTKPVGAQDGPSPWELAPDDCSLIYIVDDEPRLTDLYSIILEGIGYGVRAFNSRVDALASLKGERKKPDLLIMDYLGHAMSVDQFMQRCLLAHPALRILMATGFSQVDAKFSHIAPDRFLQKPFTAEEFLREVKAALAA